MRKLLLLVSLCAPAFAQNPRNVISAHPRMMFGGDVLMDTWEPSKTRLAAIADRVTTSGAAADDFTYMRTHDVLGNVPSVPDFGSSSNEDANLARAMALGFAYAVYHKKGLDSTANPYAAAAWAALKNIAVEAPYHVCGITYAPGPGPNATVTLCDAASPSLSPGDTDYSLWGQSNDAANVPYGGVTISAVLDSTHFTFASSITTGTYTDPRIFLTKTFSGSQEKGGPARVLSQFAYVYDWCYDWLVANGHDQEARDQIWCGYWAATLTRSTSAFNTAVREADYHNYTSIPETAILEAGTAIFGDDAYGSIILDEGAGYLWEGVQVVPSQYGGESYEYNLKKSTDLLTGGAMNWEGPTYWRSGTIRFLRALEAFDSATNRQNGIWTTQFPNAKQAGLYKMYLRQPDGTMANFADGGNSVPFAGRDNFGLVILNDRFPDAHFPWMMDVNFPDWTPGTSESTGLVYKLMFYSYVNGPGTHDLSDLPLAAKFGPDIIIRDGWGSTSTYITYTSSMPGLYHRLDNAGNFTIFKNRNLITGQVYGIGTTVYDNVNRKAGGANTLTIYDPNDCWLNQSTTCGYSYSDPLVNDGGQLMSLRRYKPQFSTSLQEIAHLWSGSLLTDPTYQALYSQFTPPAQAIFTAGASYEHLRHDMTPRYTNSFAGTGNPAVNDNPTAKVAATNGVIRELVHFQPTLGTQTPVVLYDRVTSTNATFKKTWQMHTVGAPVVDGSSISAGDTSRTGSLTKSDNGTGRVFVKHLLPASPTVRTVGGNACTPLVILDVTIASHAVLHVVNHGLQVGEQFAITTGTINNGGAFYPGDAWTIDSSLDSWKLHVDAVIDADHFSASHINGDLFNTSGLPAWTSVFASGTGTPTVDGTMLGQVYYQTDAAGGQTVWQWNAQYGNQWNQLSNTLGLAFPTLYTHSLCEWSFYADHMGPAGYSQGAINHLWNAYMEQYTPNTNPNWKIGVSPAADALTDRFLNVVMPTTTSVGTAPVTSLISAAGWDGVQVTDSGGYYVAMFPQSATLQTGTVYSVTHSGAARHVVTGLVAGTYTISQGASVLGTATANAVGSITFTESGGGSFTVGGGSAGTSMRGTKDLRGAAIGN